MAATTQIYDGNIVVEGGTGGGGPSHDTVVIVAKPATALAGDGMVIAKGGTGLTVSLGQTLPK